MFSVACGFGMTDVVEAFDVSLRQYELQGNDPVGWWRLMRRQCRGTWVRCP
jgi:hypothetical protein